MRIAVTSTGPTLEDLVGTECRQNEYLLVVELNTMDYLALINPAMILVFNWSAAGEVLAQLLLEQDVGTLLTSQCSAHTLKCLANSQIHTVVGMTGSAYAAVQEFKRMSMVSSFVLAGQASTEPRARPSDGMWEAEAQIANVSQDQTQ